MRRLNNAIRTKIPRQIVMRELLGQYHNGQQLTEGYFENNTQQIFLNSLILDK